MFSKLCMVAGHQSRHMLQEDDKRILQLHNTRPGHAASTCQGSREDIQDGSPDSHTQQGENIV